MRFSILITLLLLMLGAPSLAAPIDQSKWNAGKQSVQLANGLILSYVELGNPAGPPVLLLHGWTDSSRAWTIAAPYLGEYRLLIPDQRGHGASGKPDCCYSLADFAHDAKLLLDAKGVARAAVVGHSLGSLVGQALAANHPERVSKLILIGSTALPPVKRGDWLWQSVKGFNGPVDPGSRFMREWSASASPTPVDRAYLAYADPEVAAVPLHVWRSVLRELTDSSTAALAADIKAPTLILSGGKDSLFPPEHHRALVRALPRAKAKVLPDLGHNLILERPEEVGPAIRDFLGR
jgi:pimeloyl-ACP methyl ester carboxylesterase